LPVVVYPSVELYAKFGNEEMEPIIAKAFKVSGYWDWSMAHWTCGDGDDWYSEGNSINLEVLTELFNHAFEELHVQPPLSPLLIVTNPSIWSSPHPIDLPTARIDNLKKIDIDSWLSRKFLIPTYSIVDAALCGLYAISLRSGIVIFEQSCSGNSPLIQVTAYADSKVLPKTDKVFADWIKNNPKEIVEAVKNIVKKEKNTLIGKNVLLLADTQLGSSHWKVTLPEMENDFKNAGFVVHTGSSLNIIQGAHILASLPTFPSTFVLQSAEYMAQSKTSKSKTLKGKFSSLIKRLS